MLLYHTHICNASTNFKNLQKTYQFFNFHIFHILIRINKRSFYILYIIFLYITVLDDCLYEFIIISCLGEQVKYSFCSFICLKAGKGLPHQLPEVPEGLKEGLLFWFLILQYQLQEILSFQKAFCQAQVPYYLFP